MGGIEKYVHDLALNLLKNNIEVSIVVFYKIKNDDIEFLKSKNIRVYELDGKNGRDIKMNYSFFKIMNKIKPDIIHLNVIPVLSILALSIFKGKVIYTIHQLDNNSFVNKFFKKLIDGVIYLSDNVEKYYNKLDYLPYSKKKIINNGVVNYQENVFKRNDDVINLIMVSRLAQDKQPDLAVEIIDYLAKTSKNHYHLTLVGEGDIDDKEYIQKIENTIVNRSLSKHITFAGWKKDVMPELTKAQGFLMLSRKECFPYNVLEALSVGIPVFSFNVEGGLVDMHQNNFTGIMINNNDPLALAKEIDDVFSTDRWKIYSENAFNSSKKFSISSMTDKTIEFYQEVLKKNKV